MSFEDKLDIADKEVEKVINIVRRIIGPKTALISEPNEQHQCYRCNMLMCIVDETDKNTYYQCFGCGHKEFRE